MNQLAIYMCTDVEQAIERKVHIFQMTNHKGCTALSTAPIVCNQVHKTFQA